jgi:c-di-GMP-binding flagellar brake protein YcgR
MLKGLKRLLGWSNRDSEDEPLLEDSGDESEAFVTDPLKIAGLLKELQNTNAMLTVRVRGEGERNSYITSILAVNADRRLVAFDELNPASGHQILTRCEQFNVNGVLRGVTASFVITQFTVAESNGAAYYRAAFPKQIYHPQRRKDHRVPVKTTVLIPFEARMFEPPYFVRGHLVNVSGGGLAISVFSSAGLSGGQQLKDCKIALPDGESIYFGLEIRSIKRLRSSQKSIVGGSFLKIAPGDLVKIRRFMLTMERDQIRRNTYSD